MEGGGLRMDYCLFSICYLLFPILDLPSSLLDPHPPRSSFSFGSFGGRGPRRTVPVNST